MPEPEKLEYETEMEHREDLIGSMGLIGKFVLVGFIMAFVELIQFLPALQTFAFISFVWCAFSAPVALCWLAYHFMKVHHGLSLGTIMAILFGWIIYLRGAISMLERVLQCIP